MFRSLLAAAFAGAGLVVSAAAFAQTPPAAPPAPPPADLQPNDYGNQANWLCWPGRQDACASDLTTTVVKGDGSTEVQAFHPDPHAKIDCFYVYPTVSRDPGMISDMTVKPEETNVVVQQAARLAAHCRLYAPMYRQFTLTALTYFMVHPPTPGATPPAARPMVGYNDVKDAWNYYLAHENHGRGVILVGHSQGSGVLTQLIRNEIDGKPAQAQLVSAILMGTALAVPDGKDVGGAFANIPLCASPAQTGCAIAYSSFRETSLPPPDNTRFGRVRADGMEAACVNPASLGGGSGPTHSYFGALIGGGSAGPYPWLKGKTIATPFVSVPDLITAQCVHSGPFHVLSIHINADPASPRASDIPGDVMFGGAVQKDWGLHLIDANLFMGNLVDIVGAESNAWVKAHP
jgi:hypothetical protein